MEAPLLHDERCSSPQQDRRGHWKIVALCIIIATSLGVSTISLWDSEIGLSVRELFLNLSSCQYVAESEYALVKNTWTGKIENEVITTSGRRCLAYNKRLIRFPAYVQISDLVIGGVTADHLPCLNPPVVVKLNVTVLYRLIPSKMRETYLAYGNITTRVKQVVINTVTIELASLKAAEIVDERIKISHAFLDKVNDMLHAQGGAVSELFKITSHVFPKRIEDVMRANFFARELYIRCVKADIGSCSPDYFECPATL